MSTNTKFWSDHPTDRLTQETILGHSCWTAVSKGPSGLVGELHGTALLDVLGPVLWELSWACLSLFTPVHTIFPEMKFNAVVHGSCEENHKVQLIHVPARFVLFPDVGSVQHNGRDSRLGVGTVLRGQMGGEGGTVLGHGRVRYKTYRFLVPMTSTHPSFQMLSSSSWNNCASSGFMYSGTSVKCSHV